MTSEAVAAHRIAQDVAAGAPSPRLPSSLRVKLILIMMGITLSILLVAGAVFAATTWNTLRQSLVRELTTIAEVLGKNSTAALAFRNREDAQDVLSAVETQPNIQMALLYDPQGQLLAQYTRPGTEFAVPLTVPRTSGHSFEGGFLDIFYNIPFQGKIVGAVYLRSTTDRLTAALAEQARVILLLVFCCLMLSLLLSSILQRRVTDPINALVDATRRISEGKEPGLRAEQTTDDELGILARSFNRMLDALERRSAELSTAREALERKVEELDKEIEQRRRAELELKAQKDELEGLNERLERSNKELDEFAYVASHDLQEPLRKVQTFADRLRVKSATALDERSLQYVDSMIESAHRMRTLIDDLLMLSRVRSRISPFSTVDLNKVAQRVLSDLALKIDEVNAEISLGALPVIEADPTQMYSLFQNLIGNSLKYHHKDRRPKIELFSVPAPPGTQVSAESESFAVKDNGIGFEAQYEELIFRPFQRLHGRGSYGGTGIGLAICAKIVERHGGTIVAKGIPDEGAVFTVTLPRSQHKEP